MQSPLSGGFCRRVGWRNFTGIEREPILERAKTKKSKDEEEKEEGKEDS
jgi:hypothetical protein